ncbi:condensation domain-containing protein, partial [Rheinheimera baltica]|uniref:condensation domain-containing protein n=1 Tax=Rheinheimera baltica TaxID=67576 RepID=UPI00273E6BAF
ADYAVWQRANMDDQALTKELSYWREYLDGAPQIHELPLDFVRPAQHQSAGEVVTFNIDSIELNRLQQFANQHHVTLFMLLQSAIATFLNRWSGTEDLVLTSPAAGRHHEQLAPLIGFFVNSQIFRCQLSNSTTFRQLLQQNRQDTIQAFPFRNTPFENLVDSLQPMRDLAYAPVSQIVFALQNNDHAELTLPDLVLTPLVQDEYHIKHDLELIAEPLPDGLSFNWAFATSLFKRATIDMLATSFQAYLSQLITSPDTPVQQISLWREQEPANLPAFELSLDECAVYWQTRLKDQLYAVLDVNLQPLPVGAVGCLYVLHSHQGSRQWQKTGQWARYLTSCKVQLLGQAQQLPANWSRQDVLTVLTAMLDCPHVEDCYLRFVADAKETVTHAYIAVNAATEAFSALTQRICEQLTQSLPDKLRPQHFMLLTQLERDGAGNVLEACLPALQQQPQLDRALNEAEHQLAQLWCELLALDSVSATDNFFNLGGNSLTAVRLEFAVKTQLQADLSVNDIFRCPQLAQMAMLLNGADNALTHDIIATAVTGGRYPASFGQQRMWFVHQLDGKSQQYHMFTALELTGQVNTNALTWALEQVITRHQILRTSYTADENNQLLQCVNEPTPLVMETSDLRALPVALQQAALAEQAGLLAARSFDLSVAEMLRPALLRLTDDQFVLFICMHHIASDGWSIALLSREVVTLYQDFCQGNDVSLPALPIQFADFSAWQHQQLKGETLIARLNFWRRKLAGAPVVHTLPTDRPYPAVQSFSGSQLSLQLPEALTQDIKQLCAATDCSLFMLLQSAFALLLSHHSQQTDLVIGSPISGRTHKDSEHLIGCFLNTLTFRYQINPDLTVLQYLANCRSEILDAFQHQDLPFDLLLENLQIPRSMQHNPVFQIMFVMQNNQQMALNLPNISIRELSMPQNISQCDLSVSAFEEHGCLRMAWTYADSLFDAERIQKLAESYSHLLQQMCTNPAQPIARFSWIEHKVQDRLKDLRNRFKSTSGTPQ